MKQVFSIFLLSLVLLSQTILGARHLKQYNAPDDFNRLNLGLNFELLELEYFNRGLKNFTVADYEAIGLNASAIELISLMRDQEIYHASLLQEILGPKAAKQCNYDFPYTDLASYLDLAQVITSVGGAGYTGFTQYLLNRTNIQRSMQISGTEARQNAAFRYARNLNPLSNSAQNFDGALTESQAYSLNAPFIGECPPTNPPIPYTKFPVLKATLDKEALTVKLASDALTDYKDGLSAAFVWALNITFVPLPQDYTVKIPQGVNGTAFVIVTSHADALNYAGTAVDDSAVVAGPQGIVLG